MAFASNKDPFTNVEELLNKNFFNVNVSPDYPLTENNDTNKTYLHKLRSFINSYDFLLDILLSLLKFENCEKHKLNADDINKNLIFKGSIAFAKTNIGVVAVPYTVLKQNYKGEPTEIKLNPKFNDNDGINTSKTIKKDDFVIVYLNRAHRGFIGYLNYHAGIEACLSVLLNNNIIANSLQAILQGKAEQLNDIKNVVNAIYNQNGILKLALPESARAEDFIKFDYNNNNLILDKIAEASTNNINTFFSRCGVDYTPYEKKERLTNEEIKTNNMALDLIRGSMLETVKSGLDKVNEKFDMDLTVSLTIDTLDKKDEVNSDDV